MNPLHLLLRGGNDRRPALASTQDVLTLVADIDHDIVILRDGSRRAVLEASGVSFNLRPPDQQVAIVAGWERLLNSIDYPLQILVQVTPMDVEGYLARLFRTNAASTPALRRLLHHHAAFVRSLRRERDLHERRYYFVIPGDPPQLREGRRGGGLARLFTAWRRRGDEVSPAEQAAARRLLAWRCNQIGEGLGAIGVASRRLQGEPLATLWRDTIAGLRPLHARHWVDPRDASPVVTGIHAGAAADPRETE